MLSESTEAYDRGEKFSYYRARPSVQEYVLVATRFQLIEVFHRTPHMREYANNELLNRYKKHVLEDYDAEFDRVRKLC